MLARHSDPIVAIATAPGRGAVGIVRVSGRCLTPLLLALFGRPLKARQASYLPFLDAQGQPIDQGLVIFFAAPHSYTGEDVLELQAHGGPVVLQMLLARCLEAAAQPDPHTQAPCLPGCRLAQPGEFSERAFLNNKIDLTQAEAIADLIAANTQAAARSASRSLSGEFSGEVHRLRKALVHLRTLVEATLDFPEEDIDFLHQADAQGQLAQLAQAVRTVLQKTQQGALLREGIKVVIAGQPNAGKSSLLNALAQAELAIVSSVAGTTRDRVEQAIQIQGVPVHVVDTAGLRESQDEIEKMGIARTWQALENADVALFLHDLTRAQDAGYRANDEAIYSNLRDKLSDRVAILDVWNKADAVPPEALTQKLCLSAQTGWGLEPLRQRLLQLAGWQTSSEGVYSARARHVQALQQVAQHLQIAPSHLKAQPPALDLLAEELRLGQNALNTITGEFSADDLLGAIFSEFCIGK